MLFGQAQSKLKAISKTQQRHQLETHAEVIQLVADLQQEADGKLQMAKRA